MSSAIYFVVAIIAAIFGQTSALEAYKALLPNGNRIPHPCDRSTTWPGVGHVNSAGGLARNQFGLDFATAQRIWTETLCRADSDGDGKTNGQELGDPNCQWSTSLTTLPQITDITQLSHPGVCEPITSTACQAKNSFLLAIPICVNAINVSSTSSTTAGSTSSTRSSSSTTTSKSQAISTLSSGFNFLNLFILLCLSLSLSMLH